MTNVRTLELINNDKEITNRDVEYHAGNPVSKHPFDEIHTIIVKDISRQLKNKFNCYLYSVELLIADKESPVTMIRPDLCLYSHAPKIFKGVTSEIPEIIFEITVDEHNGQETSFKSVFYKELGVKEYWIIDCCFQDVRISNNMTSDYMMYKLNGASYSITFDDFRLDFTKSYETLVNKKLVSYKPLERQLGHYVNPNEKFDPWDWMNEDINT